MQVTSTFLLLFSCTAQLLSTGINMVTKYVIEKNHISTYMIVYITQRSNFLFFLFWVNILALDIHLGTQKYSLP